jgi:hypothetical protein
VIFVISGQNLPRKEFSEKSEKSFSKVPSLIVVASNSTHGSEQKKNG